MTLAAKLIVLVYVALCFVNESTSQDHSNIYHETLTSLHHKGEFHVKGLFQTPVQYAGDETVLDLYVKKNSGGDVKAVYCLGNKRSIMNQFTDTGTTTDGYDLWRVKIESTPEHISRMISHGPIACNLIWEKVITPAKGNVAEIKGLDLVNFNVNFPRQSTDNVVSRPSTNSQTVDKLLNDTLAKARGVPMSVSVISGICAIILVIFPIFITIANLKRVYLH
uniref:ORF25 n=1 Tax=Ostreid herpesvirus 1 TaxID=261939 RepID=A0A2L1DG03_OSHV1|nr:ORF25 [Ostreid herpesvirus 1]